MPDQLQHVRPAKGLAASSAAAGATTSAPAAQSKQRAATGLLASHPSDGNRQPVSRLAYDPQDQSQLSAPLRSQCQPQEALDLSTAAGPQHKGSAADDMVLQSPLARRLRQQEQERQQAAVQRGQRTFSSALRLHSEEAADPSSHVTRQRLADFSSHLHGRSSRQQQPQAGAAAVQYKHAPPSGHLDGSNSPRELAKACAAVGTGFAAFRSPKRSVSLQLEETIEILSDSQSQEDLEISLLSPSPAKRYENSTAGAVLALPA